MKVKLKNKQIDHMLMVLTEKFHFADGKKERKMIKRLIEKLDSKLIGLLVLAILATFTMTSCSGVSPNAGHERVLVMKPWFFGHGGVDPTPVSTGLSYVALSTSDIDFQITPITYTEDFVNLIPADNTPLSVSVYPKLQIISGMTPGLLKNFDTSWYKHNFEAPFRTAVRDQFGLYKMFDLANKREISMKLEQSLYAAAKKIVDSVGLTPYVQVKWVTCGAITPPDEVLVETRLTAAQNQGKLTQESRASFELTRKQAEINKADADKAYMNEMRMTVGEYLHLRQLEIEKEKVELIKDKKDIQLTFIMGSQSVPITYPVK
jgi:hypothetical protein